MQLPHRPQPLVFILPTLAKFEQAEQINDLFDGSPLEDRLWREETPLRHAFCVKSPLKRRDVL
jgi:hypothetical protein